LLGNDKGNAEFEHFNQLAARFGIRFIEGKYVDAKGNSKLSLKTPSGGVFYAVDVAPIELTNPSAKVLLSDRNTPLMVLVNHGKGAVFALGDPWLYNEYIGTADNRRLGLDLFRSLLRE
jgi:unsaturated rhamnogalacturonyl hydrolase